MLPGWDVFGVIAGERVLVEDGAVAAVEQSRIVVDAGHKSCTVSRNGITRVRQELAGQRIDWNRGQVRATESHNFYSPNKHNQRVKIGRHLLHL